MLPSDDGFLPMLQELSPHTTPMFVASFRLIPAGFAVLAWAALNGRPQPQGLQAWLSIAAFGLIDGAGFQVLPRGHACQLLCMMLK